MRRGNNLNLPADFARMKGDYYRTVDPRADYAAASPSKFRRTRSGLYGSGDSHYANEFKFIQLREYCRDMDRNDSVIGQGITRAVENQVQEGFKFHPNTGDKVLDDELKARMHAWACDPAECDLAGEDALPQIEFLVTRAEYVDGDIFAVLPDDLPQIQIQEAELCRTPSRTKQNVVHGVLLDKYRRPIEYWFCPDNLDPWQRFERVGDAVQIPAFDEQGNRKVLHVMRRARKRQTRGVPCLSPIFDKAGMYEDADFALLVKQQMAACLVGSWEKTGDYTADMQHGERTTTTAADGTEFIDEGFSPGQMFRPPKGMKLNVHSPNIPSSEAMEHMRRLLQIMFINLGMPLAMGLLDGKETNFSGLRWAMDMAKLGFRVNQKRRKTQFYYPLARWKIRQWMAEDPTLRQLATPKAKSLAKIDVFKHDWQAPGWPYLQPLHDAQADALKLTNMLASPTMLHAEDGREYETVKAESIRDNGSAIEAAIVEADRINKKVGKEIVAWRDVLNRDLAKGNQVIDTAETPNTNNGTSSTGGGE